MSPTRPALRWHGGKWRLAPWILAHLPPHRCYVEPFGGAASVLLRKSRSYAEVYNDLDEEVVGLFRVLRDPQQAKVLQDLLVVTPFARSEFRAAYEPSSDPVEQARRLIARSFMGFGSNAHSAAGKGHRSTGFRSNSTRSGTTPALDWRNYPEALDAIVDRLRGVVIEMRDAREVMLRHDAADTLHYVDPPYVHATRSARGTDGSGMYRHEMSGADHAELLAFLAALSGMVVLSGYPHPSYDEALPDWRRVECAAFADGARKRIEVLWINPQACVALASQRDHGPLFEAAA